MQQIIIQFKDNDNWEEEGDAIAEEIVDALDAAGIDYLDVKIVL